MKNLIQGLGLLLLLHAGHSVASEGPSADSVTMMKRRYVRVLEEMRMVGLESLRDIDTSMTMSDREKSEARLVALSMAFTYGFAVTQKAHREYVRLSQR